MTGLQLDAYKDSVEGLLQCLLSSGILGNWRELWFSRPDLLESVNQHKCQYIDSSGKGGNI